MPLVAAVNILQSSIFPWHCCLELKASSIIAAIGLPMNGPVSDTIRVSSLCRDDMSLIYCQTCIVNRFQSMFISSLTITWPHFKTALTDKLLKCGLAIL